MSEKQHILIVEDEAAIRTGLTDVFIYHGYNVTGAVDGAEGLEKALSAKYDLILLDVMMPKLSGFQVCEAIRDARPQQPIIMLTARMSDEDIVQGLKLGADDYVPKPFSVEQLVLRVAAVLRRAQPQSMPLTPLTFGDLTVDPQHLAGTAGNGDTVRFTRREMEVLQYLYHHRERPVPREELLSQVWGYANYEELETRTVDIHVAKLRRKIEPDAKSPCFITTIRGAGYKLIHP